MYVLVLLVVGTCFLNVYFGRRAFQNRICLEKLETKLKGLKSDSNPALTQQSLGASSLYLKELSTEVDKRERLIKDASELFFDEIPPNPIEFAFFVTEKKKALELVIKQRNIQLSDEIVAQLNSRNENGITAPRYKELFINIFLLKTLLECPDLKEILALKDEASSLSENPSSVPLQGKSPVYVCKLSFCGKTETSREFCNAISQFPFISLLQVETSSPFIENTPPSTYFKITIQSLLL